MPEDPGTVEEALDTQHAPEPTGDPAEAPATEAPATDFEKRYNDLRPEHDRTTSRLKEFEQLFQRLPEDPELQRQLLQQWGYEVEADEAEDDLEDTDEPLTRAQFEAYLNDQKAKQAEDQQLDATANEMRADLAALEKEQGEFSPEEWESIIDIAIAHPDQDGKPDVKAAHARLEAVGEVRQKRYVKSKKSEVVAVGQAGEKEINMADDDAVADLFANMIEAENQT